MPATLFKRDSDTDVSLGIFKKFWGQPFLQYNYGGYFKIMLSIRKEH